MKPVFSPIGSIAPLGQKCPQAQTNCYNISVLLIFGQMNPLVKSAHGYLTPVIIFYPLRVHVGPAVGRPLPARHLSAGFPTSVLLLHPGLHPRLLPLRLLSTGFRGWGYNRVLRAARDDRRIRIRRSRRYVENQHGIVLVDWDLWALFSIDVFHDCYFVLLY